jgi:hypothetical protein
MARKSKIEKIEEVKEEFKEEAQETQKPKTRAKKKFDVKKIIKEKFPEPEVIPEPEKVETLATRMTAEEKNFARMFAIYRRNVVNPESNPFFDDILGHSYTFDRFDPQENQAAYNIAKANSNRIEIGIGTVLTATGSVVPDGDGWICTLEDDGNGNGVCILYGDGPLTINTTPSMYTLDISFTAENQDIKVQNFCSCDNATFAGGLNSSFGNPVADNLHGQIHRIPFISNGTDCTGQPGGTFRDHFQIKLKNGKIGDTVRVNSMVIYRYDMI